MLQSLLKQSKLNTKRASFITTYLNFQMAPLVDQLYLFDLPLNLACVG